MNGLNEFIMKKRMKTMSKRDDDLFSYEDNPYSDSESLPFWFVVGILIGLIGISIVSWMQG